MRHFYEKGASFCAGVDLSNENLDIAKANHKASGVPEGVMSYIQGDLTKPKPVNSGKFDLVVSNCVVCYASNQEELLGFMKMAHVNLKVGGRFVLINTRQALPQNMRDELESLVGVRYDIQPEEPFLPMVGEWPNGWKGYCNYVPQDNVDKSFERRWIFGGEEVSADRRDCQGGRRLEEGRRTGSIQCVHCHQAFRFRLGGLREASREADPVWGSAESERHQGL
jgi:SAM-dependent methyltransferase